jgi:hypothetical protein
MGSTVMGSPPNRGARAPFAVWAIFLFVPAMGVLFGVIMLVSGILQLPQAKADLAAFQADASCTADLTPGPAGACRVRDAVAITVRSSSSGVRGAAVRDNLVAQFPDGSRTWAQFDGKPGVDFVRKVYPGDPIRVQTFHGRTIRVEGRGIVAKTRLSPDVAESGDRMMAWSGAGVLAVLALIGFAVFRRLRRAS